MHIHFSRLLETFTPSGYSFRSPTEVSDAAAFFRLARQCQCHDCRLPLM